MKHTLPFSSPQNSPHFEPTYALVLATFCSSFRSPLLLDVFSCAVLVALVSPIDSTCSPFWSFLHGRDRNLSVLSGAQGDEKDTLQLSTSCLSARWCSAPACIVFLITPYINRKNFQSYLRKQQNHGINGFDARWSSLSEINNSVYFTVVNFWI